MYFNEFRCNKSLCIYIYIYIIIILNINCFSTATVVTRTHLSVAFIRTLPLLFFNRLFDSKHHMNAISVKVGFVHRTLCVWLRHNNLPCKSSDLFGRLQETLTLEVLVLLNPGIFLEIRFGHSHMILNRPPFFTVKIISRMEYFMIASSRTVWYMKEFVLV
jgi:hypothetical protein